MFKIGKASNANKEHRKNRDLFITQLFNVGESLDKIAETLECSRENVRSIINRLELPPRDRSKVGKYRKE
jgi:hypothetical protein